MFGWPRAHFVHLTIRRWGPSCTWQGCPFAALKRVALLLECFAARNAWLLGLLSCKCFVFVYRGGAIKYKVRHNKNVPVRWALKELRYTMDGRKQKSKGKWGISSANRYPLYCHNNNGWALVEGVCKTLIVICILTLTLTSHLGIMYGSGSVRWCELQRNSTTTIINKISFFTLKK